MQSSAHELALGVELDLGVLSLPNLTKKVSNMNSISQLQSQKFHESCPSAKMNLLFLKSDFFSTTKI